MDPIAQPLGDDTPIIEWGLACRALGHEQGGSESGDLHVIAPFPQGVLVAVIDGLGHGAEAAVAARAAARILESDPAVPVGALVERCHEGLRRTRGAVMSLASFNSHDSSMTWLGIGNVEGVLLRANRAAARPREALATRGGVIGYQLPPFRPATLVVSPGDTLIMVTDGIRSGFTVDLPMPAGPQQQADAIMAAHRRESDDALVLVARYVGAPGE
jgi:serine phosphatase RsbU (regulator of sigma subunit)